MTRWVRNLVIGLLVLIVGAAAAGVIIVRETGREGATALEQWIGGQLKTIAGGYLKPELAFDDLDYQYPASVTVDNLRLTAVDPMTGQPLDVIAADRAMIELAETPRRGKPIVIEQIHLEAPKLRAVLTGPGKTAFVGLSDMVEAGPEQVDPTAERPKLSEVFRIRRIRISDGLLLFDDRDPKTATMRFDEITMTMNVNESDGAWYALNTELKRDGLFETKIKGRANIDTLQLELSPLTVTMQLTRQQDRYLPPAVQQLLKKHEITGLLAAQVKGTIHATDWRRSSLQLDASIRDAHAVFEDFKVPEARVGLNAALADAAVRIHQLQADAFGGQTQVTGTMQLDGEMDARLQVQARDVYLQQVITENTTVQGNSLSSLQGKLNADVTWFGPVAEAMTRSDGQGELRLTEGKLVAIPLVSRFGDAIRGAFKAIKINKDAADTMDIDFKFAGDHLNVEKVDIRSSGYAVRGNGTVGLDGTLDLTFNGGPLEKLQSAMGGIGKVFGALTDQLARYHVTGHVGEPKIQMKVGPKLGQ